MDYVYFSFKCGVASSFGAAGSRRVGLGCLFVALVWVVRFGFQSDEATLAPTR